MAVLKDNDIIDFIANECNLSTRNVKKIIETFCDKVFIEMNRNNEVELDCFGTFKPHWSNTTSENGYKVVSHLACKFKLTPKGLNLLNGKIVRPDGRRSKKQLKLDAEVSNEELEIIEGLVANYRKKYPLKDVVEEQIASLQRQVENENKRKAQKENEADLREEESV